MVRSEATCRVAYLINQYPKVSHTFIRREILALERQGVQIERIAIRGWDDAISDDADRVERERTRYVLKAGVLGLAAPTLRAFLTRPRKFLAALALTWRLARGSDRSWLYHLVYLAEASRIVGWLLPTGVDHVHAHFGTNSATVAALVQELGGPRYSFTVHGPEEFDRPESLHLGDKVERAAFVAAISSYGKSQLCRWASPAHWSKIQVVHCGLEPEFHRISVEDPPDTHRLVCVGRLCEQKAQLLLIRAADRLVRQGLALELVLAGDGEMRPEIEALVQELGLQSHVRITGWISSAEVRQEILAARALVLASFAEGLPVVLMEAMALRRPVIATYVAGIPELVRDGQDGWLCAAGDIDALAAAMQACLAASPAELSRMAASAHARVLARHDIDREASKLAALFCRPAPMEA